MSHLLDANRSRTRLLNFRVSADEYTLLHRRAVEAGSRSISDFCREKIQIALADQPSVLERLSRLEARLGALDGQ